MNPPPLIIPGCDLIDVGCDVGDLLLAQIGPLSPVGGHVVGDVDYDVGKDVTTARAWSLTRYTWLFQAR